MANNANRDALIDGINAFQPLDLDALSDDELARLLEVLQSIGSDGVSRNSAGPGGNQAKKFSERGGNNWASRRQ
jgi:hypothetical protein